ncbi:MAG: hypothetical protein ABEI77_06850 [Halorientalis sp.]
MTATGGGASRDDERSTGRRRVLVWQTLDEAATRLVEEPSVLALFVFSFLVSAGVNQVMRMDPVPVTANNPVVEVNIDGGPVGTTGSLIHSSLGAYYGLRLPWLIERAALFSVTSLVSLVVIVLAVAAIDTGGLRSGLEAVTPATFLRAASFLLGLGVLFGTVGGAVALFPILALPGLLGLLLVLIRLSIVLPLLVRGQGVRRSIRASWRRVAGHGLRIFGIVLVLGFLSGLVTDLPAVGGLLEKLVLAVQISGLTVVADVMTPASDLSAGDSP